MKTQWRERIFYIWLLYSVLSPGGVSRAFEESKIIPDDPFDGDQFGSSVDISGDYLIVGAHEDDDMGERSGSAYIFKRQGGEWTQNAKLVAPDGTSGDQFGYSVSISGDYALIGAFRDNEDGNQAGSAYMFRLVGGTWTFVTKLKPVTPEMNSEFGNSVVTDGNYAVIGAHRSEHFGQMTGAVYVFERNGATWVQDARLVEDDLIQSSFFGCDCAISGNELVVGAHGYTAGELGTGAVYVYRHDGVHWIRQYKLSATDETQNASFGRSVAIRVPWLLIGASGADGQYPDCGAGYMFHLESGTWVAHSKLLPIDPQSGAGFGYSVDIDSGYAVIGAPFFGDSPDDLGRLDIFRLNGDVWTQHLALTASDETEGARFGVAATVQAEECLTGALSASDGGIESGAAYLYGDIGTIPPTPTPSAFIYDLELYDTNLDDGDLFLLNRTYFNPGGAAAVDEYIILDIYGAYWFWPAWTPELDFTSWTIPAGGNGTEAILQFEWPTVEGEVTGLKFWGAFLNAGTAELIVYDMQEWGYSDK